MVDFLYKDKIQSKNYLGRPKRWREYRRGSIVLVGPDTGESDRSQFDNADDFDGFTETSGNLQDAGANAYGSLFQVFTRQVQAVYNSQTPTGFSAAVAGLTVTITVTDATGRQWTLVRFVPQPVS